MARLERDRGHFNKAEPLFKSAINTQRQLISDAGNQPSSRLHYQLSSSLLRYGRMHIAQEQPAAARALFEEALDLRKRYYEQDDHWRIAVVEVDFGWCLSRLGQYEQAEALLLQGYQTLSDKRGETDPQTLEALEYLATFYEDWNQPEQAEMYRSKLK